MGGRQATAKRKFPHCGEPATQVPVRSCSSPNANDFPRERFDKSMQHRLLRRERPVVIAQRLPRKKDRPRAYPGVCPFGCGEAYRELTFFLLFLPLVPSMSLLLMQRSTKSRRENHSH